MKVRLPVVPVAFTFALFAKFPRVNVVAVRMARTTLLAGMLVPVTVIPGARLAVLATVIVEVPLTVEPVPTVKVEATDAVLVDESGSCEAVLLNPRAKFPRISGTLNVVLASPTP